jgi:putative ABC transport system ATP-binding protein
MHARKAKVMAALQTVSIEDRAHHYPNQLSGGQQQRVAVARAIVNEPVLLLADEPTGNLDSRTSVEVMCMFQDLHNKGITIILVTHETDISQYADRIITFRDGKIRTDIPNTKKRIATEDLKALPPVEQDTDPAQTVNAKQDLSCASQQDRHPALHKKSRGD